MYILEDYTYFILFLLYIPTYTLFPQKFTFFFNFINVSPLGLLVAILKILL